MKEQPLRRPVSWTWTLALALLVALVSMGSACGRGDGPAEIEGVVFVEGLGPAEIEEKHPLTDEGRKALTPESIETLAQWQVDQVYARLDPGPIPDGPWQGRFFFAAGGGPKKLSERLPPLSERLANFKLEKVDRLGQALWKGKVFYRDEGVLRNMIDHDGTVADLFDADPASIPRETVDGKDVAVLFPAQLYCGDSLYDPRKESVIIDYAETATLPGYVEPIDRLAGKDGLLIRDEIRLVRPGFYLGRAYAKGKMLLTFTLYDPAREASGQVDGTPCWNGEGERVDPASRISSEDFETGEIGSGGLEDGADADEEGAVDSGGD